MPVRPDDRPPLPVLQFDGPNGRQKVECILILGRESAAPGGDVFTLIPELPNQPSEVGILLADVARHYGNMYERAGGPPGAEVVLLIKRQLDAEWGLTRAAVDRTARSIGRSATWRLVRNHQGRR